MYGYIGSCCAPRAVRVHAVPLLLIMGNTVNTYCSFASSPNHAVAVAVIISYVVTFFRSCSPPRSQEGFNTAVPFWGANYLKFELFVA